MIYRSHIHLFDSSKDSITPEFLLEFDLAAWRANLTKQQRTDYSWMHLAIMRGFDMSKDPSRKLGAVAVAADGVKSSFGYNGFAPGIPDTPEFWKRPTKYDYVIHAEENAVANATFDLSGGTIYCMLKPCYLCLRPLAKHRIKRLVWLEAQTPFREDKPHIFEEYVKRGVFESAEVLPLDPLTQALFELYQHSHDGYKNEAEATNDPCP